jgi:D-amino-acid dehydrogenase
MRVIVLGAGVIGVTSAYYLSRAGHEVTVIDRQPGCGLETSFANGGQISASHAEPWASPAALVKALKWLGNSDAPLLFRFQRDPDFWSWCLRFLRNCTESRININTERLLRVALYSRKCLAELRSEIALDYDPLHLGILHIYDSEKDFAQARVQAKRMNALGCERHAISAKECLEKEPALSNEKRKLVGGIFCPEDESGNAYKFTAALAEISAELGATFRYETSITRLLSEGGRISGVETDQGVISADAFVLSLGSYSPKFAKPLGLRLPIIPAKGYSVSLPILEEKSAPKVSLIDDRYKMVYSRLGATLRVAGTAELVGFDTTINDRRARLLLDRAAALFPHGFDPNQAEFWTGLRPQTPDHAPIIGVTRYPNLFLNTGHGTLGWTMACGSGQIIADLVDAKTSAIPLDGLGLDRY